MTIIVTGAAGYVGSSLIKAWDRSEKIIAIDNRQPTPSDQWRCELENVMWPSINLLDGPAVTELFKETFPDSVIHLATAGHTRDAQAGDYLIAANTRMTLNVLSAAQRLPGCKVVVAGSAAEYGDLPLTKSPCREHSPLRPGDAYAESKAFCSMMAEGFRLHYEVPVIVLRFANIYGPGQPADKLIPIIIRTLLSGEKMVLNGGGAPTRQYLYIDDVIQTVRAALSMPRVGIFNIGAEAEYSNAVIAAMVLAELQHQFPGRFPEARDCIILREGQGGAARIAMNTTKAALYLRQPHTWISEGIHRTVLTFLKERELEDRTASGPA